MQRTISIVVSGRVQGVYFRANTQKQALKLGVNGWVKNLTDGGVQVYAQGEAGAVEQLLAWCRKGPAFARVEQLSVTEVQMAEIFTDFQVLADSKL